MSDHMNPAGRLPHVVKAVMETPWAIEPSVLAAICELVAIRNAGGHFSDEEIQARVGRGPARRDLQMAGPVAVIPIHGVITPRADLFTEISGGTSIQRLIDTFSEAVDDKKVAAIVFDVASPGGMVDLVTEAAAEIRKARGRKPIVAVANTNANSAALWLASQADELVATPSARVGSIGVFAAHEDWSKHDEEMGVKTTLISAGKHKVDGNPFEPLSDEARRAIQERIDDSYAMFTADVAKGRRVPVTTVRGEEWEDASRVLTAKQALRIGLIDRVDTLQGVIDVLTNGRAVAPVDDPPDVEPVLDDARADARELPQAASSGLSFADEAAALHDSAVALTGRLTSLAEVERGHLTVAKRDRLTACTGALREVTDELEQVLAATDPDKHRKAAVRERARMERLRLTSLGGKA